MSTSKTIRQASKAEQAGIPADHVFDVTRALMRDQRPARAATQLKRAQIRGRAAQPKAK